MRIGRCKKAVEFVTKYQSKVAGYDGMVRPEERQRVDTGMSLDPTYEEEETSHNGEPSHPRQPSSVTSSQEVPSSMAFHDSTVTDTMLSDGQSTAEQQDIHGKAARYTRQSS